MLDYQEAVQELEHQGGHGKEVEGDVHLTMVREEGEPMFGSIAASPEPEIAGIQLCRTCQGSENSSLGFFRTVAGNGANLHFSRTDHPGSASQTQQQLRPVGSSKFA
jgi:hypothetical protein